MAFGGGFYRKSAAFRQNLPEQLLNCEGNHDSYQMRRIQLLDSAVGTNIISNSHPLPTFNFMTVL